MTDQYIEQLQILKGTQSKYNRNHQFKDRRNRDIPPPNPDKETIKEFLTRCGFDIKLFEGSSSSPHRKFFTKTLEKYPQIKSLMEIGFNAGYSADMFLSARNDTKLISFDIIDHDYVKFAKAYIDSKFPGRHTLIAGSSLNTLKSFKNINDIKVDLIFIDGAHLYDIAYADIVNMKEFAHIKTVGIMDNITPHRGSGREVYYAYRKAIDNNIILHDRHSEVRNYDDGFTRFFYKFKESKFKGHELDIDYLERKVPVTRLAYKLNKIPNKHEFNEITDEIRKHIETNDIFIDEYLFIVYNKTRKRLGIKNSNDIENKLKIIAEKIKSKDKIKLSSEEYI